MRIDVALVPAEARRWHDMVHVVIDELRASSTIVTLLERGATEVVPAASLAEARRIAAADRAATVLAGELRVVAPPGFDLGNSPAEVTRIDVRGRRAVLATRNGTAVLRSLPPGAPTFVGCLLDATAVARAALDMARRRALGVGIVCAGRRGTFAIDDAIAAGCLLERLLAAAGADVRELDTVDGRQGPEPAGSTTPSDPIVLTDAARAVLQLWRSTPDVDAAYRASWSGYLLAAHGLLEDIAFSTRVDATDLVPVVEPGPPLRIVVGRPDAPPGD